MKIKNVHVTKTWNLSHVYSYTLDWPSRRDTRALLWLTIKEWEGVGHRTPSFKEQIKSSTRTYPQYWSSSRETERTGASPWSDLPLNRILYIICCWSWSDKARAKQKTCIECRCDERLVFQRTEQRPREGPVIPWGGREWDRARQREGNRGPWIPGHIASSCLQISVWGAHLVQTRRRLAHWCLHKTHSPSSTTKTSKAHVCSSHP